MRAFLTAALLLVLAAPAQARIDREFAGGKGFRTLSVGAHDSGAEAMMRTRTGKLLMVGWADRRFALARFHPSGRLDRRFGKRGRALISARAHGSVVGLHELPDRKLLIAFPDYGSQGIRFCVLRAHASGKLDRGYGERGVVCVFPPAAGGSLVAMAVEPGGSVVLAGNTGEFLSGRRVVLARAEPEGRSTEFIATLDLDGGSVVDMARTRIGHLVVAANRVSREGRLTGSVLAGVGDNPWRREIEGARILDLDRDRASGVAALLARSSRWGVRRFTQALQPRPAPATLRSRGAPSTFAVTSGSSAWVGFRGGKMRRVRPDGRLDPKASSGRLRSRYMLDPRALVPLPRNRVAAAGLAFPEGPADIREDYGTSKMWIGRFRR